MEGLGEGFGVSVLGSCGALWHNAHPVIAPHPEGPRTCIISLTILSASGGWIRTPSPERDSPKGARLWSPWPASALAHALLAG